MADPQEQEQPVLRRNATGLLVILDGEITDQWRCVECEENAGGARTSYAVLEHVGEREKENQPPYELIFVHDLLKPNVGLDVAIAREFDQAVLHWGRATQVQLGIEPHGQVVRLVSRFEPYHLGRRRLTGLEVYPPGASVNEEKSELDADFVFNPILDGRVWPNMGQDSLTGHPYKTFIHPDSARTQPAWEANNLGDRTEYWTLLEVLLHLFWRCNPWEKYVTNPTREQLTEQLGTLAELPGVIRNRRIRWGSWLGEALDQVLNPLGFSWGLDHTNAVSRTVRIFSASDAATEFRSLLLQNHGEKLDTTKTEVRSLNLAYSASQVVNHVELVCDYLYVEHTFVLGRAWPKTMDANQTITAYDEVVDDKPNPQWEGGNGELRNAWRRWSLNEAGQYDVADYEREEADQASGSLSYWAEGLNTELTGAMVTRRLSNAAESYELGDDALAGPRRWFGLQRKFLPTLTINEMSGEPLGPDAGGTLIEWTDAESVGEDDWRPIAQLLEGTGCSVELLDNEMGIYIRGQRPPQALIAAGDKAKIRITATVRSDRRERVFPGEYDYDGEPPSGEHSDQSILGDLSSQPLDAGKRFQFRGIRVGSKFATKVLEAEARADLVDDIFPQPSPPAEEPGEEAPLPNAEEAPDPGTTPPPSENLTSPAKQFADEVLKRFNTATASGTAVLEGLDRYRWRVGDAIIGLDPKIIHWHLNLEALAAPRVMAIRYDEERQTTTLVLGTESPTAREVI